MNAATPDNFQPVDHDPDTLFREVDPTATSLIEALNTLPPETAIEVGSNDWDGGATEPTGIWYYPTKKKAFIG